MTRETKIGLLVGLAFIIVIGILLSDHLTQSTEPQPAVLAIAGNSVRSGITVPGVTGNAGGANNPPITQVPPPSNVQPTSAVPTRDEVTRREPPVQIIQVGAPTLSASGGQSPQSQSSPRTSPAQQPSSNDNVAITAPPAQQNAEPATPQDQAGGAQVATQDSTTPEPSNNTNQSGPTVTQTPQSVAGAINNALKNAAKQAGEDLVSVGGSGDNNSSGSPQSRTGTTASTQPPVAGTKYVAAEGDTLNKLAGRFLGGNTKANRDAIMAANPFMKGDPNKIIVGRTYIIPTAGAPAPAPGQAASAAAPSREVPPTQAKSNTSTAATESWYTVKEGDSLWKIATDQCGGPGAIDAIKELNKDTLKGGDTVVVNTKLRLPSKPVASAN